MSEKLEFENGASIEGGSDVKLKGSTNDFMYLMGNRVFLTYRNGKRYIDYGDEFRVNVSTRAGRMAARAYALTYLAEEPNELRGDEVYNEIIKLIGESE